MDTDPADDFQFWARFENKDEFVALRDELLAIDLYAEPTSDEDRAEAQLSNKLTYIVGHVPCHLRTYMS